MPRNGASLLNWSETHRSSPFAKVGLIFRRSWVLTTELDVRAILVLEVAVGLAEEDLEED